MSLALSLLWSLELLTLRQAPAGTPLHIRLTSAVGSFASRPGEPLRAVLIAPVAVGDETLLPQGSTLSGKVKSVQRVGLGVVRETATLDLEFNQVTLPNGQSVPISARVARVDNGREHVNQEGSIRGVRTTGSVCYRASGYIRTVLAWHVEARLATWAIKTLIVQVPEPEIFYPPGVELTLALTEPLLSIPPAEPPQTTRRLSGEERAEVTRLVQAIPYRTYSPSSNRPSDLINLLFIGSRDQLAAAFTAAGWTETDSPTLRSRIKGIQAVAESRGYRAAPMSALLLSEAEPDTSWQKGFNSVAKRHHIRVWKQSDTWRGQELWAGAATHDIDFAYLRPGQPLTHRIEENVDLERDKIAHDLIFTSCVDVADWLERSGVPGVARNATGDLMMTDTRVAVIQLNDCEAPRTTAQYAEAARLPARGNVLQRFVRREILSVRSDLIRTNPYWRSYEGARWLFTAIRRHKRLPSGPDASSYKITTSDSPSPSRLASAAITRLHEGLSRLRSTQSPESANR